MKKLLTLLLLYLICLPMVRADVLVLVHGYMSNAMTWQYSGVSNVLVANGWRHAASANPGGNTFYTVNLPARQPLMTQTHVLMNFLRGVRQHHPSESLTLVGHSAGGLVARLAVLGGNPAGVSQLVTIASPHLGTPRAIQGLDIAEEKPFFCPGPGWFAMKRLLGGKAYRYLRDSRGALVGMLPPGYGELLSWANTQPHPDIRYHAVVRQFGDELVPAYSQDMNSVPVLKGRARVWLSNSRHSLSLQDGEILLRILADQAN